MIYALRGSGDPDTDAMIYTSLTQGVGRFGWSYIPTANLHELQARIDTYGWNTLNEQEQDCYQGFLLNLEENDYVVYINVPEWGNCTLAHVTGNYFWVYDGPDFNHRFPVDPESVFVFDRNAAIVHPSLSSRLKLRGRYWHINAHQAFNNLVGALNAGI